jgi:hypothetical protein
LGSALGELWLFSAPRWRALFTRCGWQVERVTPAGLFYSGHLLAGGRLNAAARRRLAGWLGSSCQVFVLRKV